MEKLAILGGMPISNKKLYKKSPIGKEEITAVMKVLKNGILSKAGYGENVKRFEKDFAVFHKVKYALSTPDFRTGTPKKKIATANIKLNSAFLRKKFIKRGSREVGFGYLLFRDFMFDKTAKIDYTGNGLKLRS